MKLDTKAMRHLTADDWRVLTAVEMGSKNHELVPTPLIEKIAHLRGGAGAAHRSISTLAKAGLVARVREARYDGYRLTYGGLDYLALHAHAARRDVYSVCSDRAGVGKESDIVVVADERGVQRVLKIHRLGRVSFRTVRANRDYLRGGRQCATGSWMYLSRLAAMREFAFMRALRDAGFPVPEPLAQSRHTIVMSLVDAPPLRQIASVPDPAGLYAELIGLILRLARHGLIHGDFNEFNILIKEEEEEEEAAAEKEQEDKREEQSVSNARDPPAGEVEKGQASPPQPPSPRTLKLTPVIIDFPQMVSMDHRNAEMYFDRDVNCIKSFFRRRFHFTSSEPGPFYEQARKTVGKGGASRLDAAAEASGFTKKMAKDLEAAIQERASKEGAADDAGSVDTNEDDAADEEDEDGDEDEELEDLAEIAEAGGSEAGGRAARDANEGLRGQGAVFASPMERLIINVDS